MDNIFEDMISECTQSDHLPYKEAELTRLELILTTSKKWSFA